MKNFLLIFAMVFLACSSVNAQDYKNKYKNRKEMLKSHKEMQNMKADKDAVSAAKQMTKEGWKVMPGQKTLAKQIELASIYQDEVGEDILDSKYIWGDATSVATMYDAGKLNAIEAAVANIVNQLERHITSVIELKRSNEQISMQDAVSLNKVNSAATSLVEQHLGRLQPVVECYRPLSGGSMEVRVMIFYSTDVSKEIYKQGMRDILEKEGNELSQKLEDILGW